MRIITIAAALLLGVLAVLPVFSQEDITEVADSAFDPREMTRPPVRFAHDAHNGKAELGECGVCHHVYDENGMPAEGESSEGTECSECHFPDKGDTLSLVRAYHLQCRGCHEERKAGPVTCGECHLKP